MNTNKLLLVFIGIVSLSVGSKDSNSVSNTLNNQTTFRSNADSLFNLKNQINFPTISENETPDTTSNLTSNLTRFKRHGTSNSFSNLTSHEIQRLKRNADPLSDYSGKLSTVARISNGISLLAGLINKNIPIDNVISELLNFGNVKLTDVLALQKDKVEAVISQLKTTKQNLDETTKVIALEDNTIGMAQVREAYMKMDDFENFQHPTDFFAEAKSFETDTTTDYSVFKSTVKLASEALEQAKKLENPPTITIENKGTFEDCINILHARLNSLTAAAPNFENIVKKVDSFSQLANWETILEPVKQIIHVLAIHRGIKLGNAANAAGLGKNFDPISALSNTILAAQMDIVVLNGFVSSRLVQPSGKRQFTSGFPNGAADLKKLVKDIRDPVFESTIGGGKNFARLSDGLKPLVDWSVKLNTASALFTPIATTAVLQSTSNAVNLKTFVSGLRVTSNDAESVTKLFGDNKFDLVDQSRVDPVIKVMENAAKLAQDLAQFKSTASKVTETPPEVVTEIKTILETFPPNPNINDVQDVVGKLKSANDKVKKVSEYLSRLQGLLQDIPDIIATRKLAQDFDKTKNEFVDFKTEVDRDVVKKLKAIKDSKEPIEAVVRAIEACKIVRSFEKSDLDNIRSAVDTITKASGSLKELQKPPANRKKRQTDEVKELIGFKDSQKTSAALGSAAITISSMAQLKGLETTVIQDLKSKSTIFDTEVAKVTDSSKKSEILNKWGDHVAFTSSLDSTINQINAFGAKISVDKDLRKLGAHLNDAKAVGDVNQNIAEKSDAVGILILETSDAKAKTELEALKTQLDILAALDLQFSNHHSAFPGVTGALKSLFDFVTGFVTPKQQPSGASGAGGAGGAAGPAEPPLDWWWYLAIAGIAIVLVIMCWTIGKYFYNRPVGFRKIQKYYFKKALKTNWSSGTAMATGAMNDLKDEDKGASEGCWVVPSEKMRYSDVVVFRTRVWGGVYAILGLRPAIDANYISVPGSSMYIATQGPMAKDEQPGKVDTIADFWAMVFAHKTDVIVQLCNFLELDDFAVYFSCPNRIPSKKCSKYYPLEKDENVTFGEYKITSLGHSTIFNGYVELHILLLSKNGGTPRKIELYHHKKWPDHGIPDNLEVVVDMVIKTKKSKYPIVVHCSAGRGRTMTYMAVDLLASYAERHPNASIDDMLMMIRNQRFKGLQESDQCWLAITGSTMFLAKKYNQMKVIFDKTQMATIEATMGKLREETYEVRLATHTISARNIRCRHAREAGRDAPQEVLNLDRAQIAKLKSVEEIIAINEKARDENTMAIGQQSLDKAEKDREEEKAAEPRVRAEKLAAEKAAEAEEDNKGTPQEVKAKLARRAWLMTPLSGPARLVTDVQAILKSEEKKKMKKEAEEAEEAKKKSAEQKSGSTAKTNSQETEGKTSAETGTASKSREPAGHDDDNDQVVIEMPDF